MVVVLAVLALLLKLAAKQRRSKVLGVRFTINNTLKPADEAHLNGVEVRCYGSYAPICLHLNIDVIDNILNLCGVTVKWLQKA